MRALEDAINMIILQLVIVLNTLWLRELSLNFGNFCKL